MNMNVLNKFPTLIIHNSQFGIRQWHSGNNKQAHPTHPPPTIPGRSVLTSVLVHTPVLA